MDLYPPPSKVIRHTWIFLEKVPTTSKKCHVILVVTGILGAGYTPYNYSTTNIALENRPSKNGKLSTNFWTILVFWSILVFGRGIQFFGGSQQLGLQIRLTRKSELQLGIAPKSGAWHPKVPRDKKTQLLNRETKWLQVVCVKRVGYTFVSYLLL